MISTNMNTPENRNELDWTAFCYAASELPADEAAAFENRLGEDQAAREALARAVELTQAVASAETMQPVVVVRSRSSVWTRRLTWMAIGSAASLLIALLWTGSDVNGRLAGLFAGKPEAPAVSGELAAAWMAAQEELAAAAASPAYLPPISESEIAEIEAAADLADMPETPAWMTIAVASLAGQPVATPEALDIAPFSGERGDN
jgi:hypothetical protein